MSDLEFMKHLDSYKIPFRIKFYVWKKSIKQWWNKVYYFSRENKYHRQSTKFAKYNYPKYKVWFLSNGIKKEMVSVSNIKTMQFRGWLLPLETAIERFGEKAINILPSIPYEEICSMFEKENKNGK
jgi:hypothetical protein